MDFDLIRKHLAVSCQPLHKTIAEELQKAIVSGALPAGSKLPPDKAFARQLGVNHITLAKALNGLRARGLLQRRRAYGTFVASPEVRDASGRRVAVVFDEATAETFQCSLFLNLHRELAASGLSMVFYSAEGSAAKQCALLKRLVRDPSLEGCIFWSILNRTQAGELLAERPADFPLVFLDRIYDGLLHDAATYDDFNAAQALGRTLRDRGYTRILWLRQGSQISSVDLRHAGLCAGLEGIHPEQGPAAEKNAEVLVCASEKEYISAGSSPVLAGKPRYTFSATDALPGIFFDCASLASGAVEILRRRLNGEDTPLCRTAASWRFAGLAGEMPPPDTNRKD